MRKGFPCELVRDYSPDVLESTGRMVSLGTAGPVYQWGRKALAFQAGDILYDRHSTAGPQAHCVAAGACAVSGANLHAAGGTNVHASQIDGKTCR